MKTYFALVCVLCCPGLLRAQPAVSPAAADSNRPGETVTDDRTELMLRRLRDALTNPPVAPGPQQVAQPAPGTPRAVAIPPPRATNFPAVNAPVPAAQRAPAPLPGAAGATNRPGTALANTNANVFPAAPGPATGAVLPSPRALPARPAVVPAPQPNLNLPGVPLPGAAVNVPGGAPGPQLTTRTNPVVTVASNVDPNEVIPAGTI